MNTLYLFYNQPVMFGKKIKNWSEYKFKLTDLLNDLKNIYAGGDTISSKHAKQIIDKIRTNMLTYKNRYHVEVNAVIKFLVKKNLLEKDDISFLVKEFSFNPTVFDFVDVLKGNLLTQSDYWALFMNGRSDLFDKLDNSCTITPSHINIIFENRVYSPKCIEIFKNTHPKFYNLLKQNNIQLTVNNLIDIIGNLQKKDNTRQVLYQRSLYNVANDIGGTTDHALNKFIDGFKFCEQNGYVCNKLDIAHLFSIYDGFPTIIEYLVDTIMPKYNLTADFDFDFYKYMILRGYRVPKTIAELIYKIPFTENMIMQILYLHNINYDNDLFINNILEKIKFDLTPKIIENAYVSKCDYIMKKALETDQIVRCDLNKIFKYSYFHYDTNTIKYLLNNRYLPNRDMLLFMMICASMDTHRCNYTKETLSLLFSYGLQIKEENYDIFTFNKDILNANGIRIPDNINKTMNKYYLGNDVIVDSGEHQIMWNSNIYNTIVQYDMYSIPSYDEQNYIFLRNTDFNIAKLINLIITDKSMLHKETFSNSLLNINLLVFEYLHDNYNYIPTVLDIMKIKNYHRRFLMMKRFYSKMLD